MRPTTGSPTSPGATSPVLTPAFALQCGMEVVVEQANYLVHARLGDARWHLMRTDDGFPLFQSDVQLAQLMQRGDFHLAGNKPGLRLLAPPPLSPIAQGPETYARNQRKHDYVIACTHAPGGLRRSRSALLPIITAVAEQRGEQRPSFTTVLNWIDEWETYGAAYGTAAYCDRYDLRGSRKLLLPKPLEQAIEVGIDSWLKTGNRIEAYDLVCGEVMRFSADNRCEIDPAVINPRFIDDLGKLKPPSLRTFQRRCDAINRFERDWALKGPAYAKRKNRTWQRTPRPDRPYQEIEVDHTTLDILLIDEHRGLVLGRPDLIVFRDRCTAMIAGYGLGFEAPSYASFVQGLRHAMHYKERPDWSQATSEWPCMGAIENLYVDNALHFIGDNIRQAGRELNFNLVKFQPRQPWLKGALERFFGTLNTGLVHSLEGTTLENVLARRDHETLGEPVLTLREFEVLLDWWIRDVYHRKPTKSLGLIRGLGGVPIEEWQARVKHHKTPLLPSKDLFMWLAGDAKKVTIQNDGITWDRITYESPDLWALRSDPDHRRPDEGGSTRYDARRDPFDLGSISLVDPRSGEVIIVPATLEHRLYATGLSLHQHRVIVANSQPQNGHKLVFDDLLASRDRLARVVTDLRRSPGRKQVQKALARYIHVEQSRRHQSKIWIAEPPVSGGDFLQLEGRPIPEVPYDTGETDDAPSVAPLPAPEEVNLDEARRRKSWDAYHA